ERREQVARVQAVVIAGSTPVTATVSTTFTLAEVVVTVPAGRSLEGDVAAPAEGGNAGKAVERSRIALAGNGELGEVGFQRVRVAHVAQHVRRGEAVAVRRREDARGALEHL
ncbi:MAG: hypothetical protein ACK55I_32885, partial [bacterium]